MSDQLAFRCESCNARLRVAVRLLGRTGRCPRCGHQMTVRVRVPEAEGPVLVGDDGPVARRFLFGPLD